MEKETGISNNSGGINPEKSNAADQTFSRQKLGKGPTQILARPVAYHRRAEGWQEDHSNVEADLCREVAT